VQSRRQRLLEWFSQWQDWSARSRDAFAGREAAVLASRMRRHLHHWRWMHGLVLRGESVNAALTAVLRKHRMRRALRQLRSMSTHWDVCKAAAVAMKARRNLSLVGTCWDGWVRCASKRAVTRLAACS
jgi:hypothetical protein